MTEFLDRVRAFAATFEGSYEDFPWRHETPVFKNANGKIFAMTGINEDGALLVTMKLSPEEGGAALGLPFVSRASYVGRFGWVSASVANDAEWDLVVDWISQSYALVSPARKRAKKKS